MYKGSLVLQLLKTGGPVREIIAATGISQSKVYNLKKEYEGSLPDVPRQAFVHALRECAEWMLKRAAADEVTPIRQKEPFGDFSYTGQVSEALLRWHTRLRRLNDAFVGALADMDRIQASDTAFELACALLDVCNRSEVA